MSNFIYFMISISIITVYVSIIISIFEQPITTLP